MLSSTACETLVKVLLYDINGLLEKEARGSKVSNDKRFDTFIYYPVSRSIRILYSEGDKWKVEKLVLIKGGLPKYSSFDEAIPKVKGLIEDLNRHVRLMNSTGIGGIRNIRDCLYMLYAVYLVLYDSDLTLSRGLIH